MKFAEFQLVRERILRERPEILDCAATNLYAALARFIPPTGPAPQGTVHRCHLAVQWAKRFGLSAELSQYALVSGGVRDSLAILFRHFAGEKPRLWLPQDNYPVYGELARQAGLMPDEFITLPQPIWPNEPPRSDRELLVVTNPLKPLGRWLSESDVDALIAWLAVHSGRRLLLDAVYTFGTQFHPTTLRLLERQQTILLHSLTKGWLQPRLFGVALVPAKDAAVLAPCFRPHSPPQANLARAHDLLANHAEVPQTIAGELDFAQIRLPPSVAPRIGSNTSADAHGYFTLIGRRWEDILGRDNVLGLPATAFGSKRDDFTILSSLNFVP